MRVLVVEDDRALGAFLKVGLESEGHTVDWVEDGEAALVRLLEQRPDLMVLDLSLPKRDGMEVLAAMRARHDDCLLKPFSFFELTARCRALLRRREQFADPILRYGDLQLNRIERKVQRGDRAIDLTVKEFALLEYLLLHSGECVSRSQLLAELWQMSVETGTNVVDVYVNYLRRKLDNLDPHPASESLIQTVRGTGYRLGPAIAKPIARSAPPEPSPIHVACA
jgi:DNA-binding response OmpR family regulator